MLGNVGTLISFRLGPQDAALLGREFIARFEPIDFMNLANHHIYLRLMIDGAPSMPFSATTIMPHEVPAQDTTEGNSGKAHGEDKKSPA